MAIVSGLADAADYPTLLKVFQSTSNASPLYENYVIQAMFEMGEPQAALARIRTRYAEQVQSEHSTLWETWKLDETSTFSHAWGGGSLYLLPGVCRRHSSVDTRVPVVHRRSAAGRFGPVGHQGAHAVWG